MSLAAPERRRERPRWRYPYEPTPKQSTAHQVYADEVLFGGAAGPGKTDWLLAEAVTHCLEVPKASAVLFRRTFPDLSRPRGIIYRLLDRLPQPTVASYHGTDHVWTFRNGSVLALSHLQYERDVLNHQGAEYSWVGFDELTQFAEYQYLYLGGRLRASGELLANLKRLGIRPMLRSASNPGGPGHNWVKARFIDPAPPYVVWRPSPTLDEPDPGTRVFIPGLLADNPHVDEGTRRRLAALPSDDRRALLEGDWDVYAGQRFPDWRRDLHVIDPEDLPVHPGAGAVRALGLDYGLDAPYAALWAAKVGELVVIYREAYKPGLTPKQQAQEVLELEAPGERGPQRPVPVYADPSTWTRSPGSPAPASPKFPPKGSIAWTYRQAGLVPLHRANNDRLAGAALWAEKLRVHHVGHDLDEPCPGAEPLGALLGTCGPRVVVYSTCRNLIRTLPALPRDPSRPEDVDTKAEDHAYDAGRYVLHGLETAPSGTIGGPAAKDTRTRKKSLTVGRSASAGLRRKSF